MSERQRDGAAAAARGLICAFYYSPVGAASYPDFTNPQMRAWWANMFSYDNYEVREALPYPLTTAGCLAVALAQRKKVSSLGSWEL